MHLPIALHKQDAAQGQFYAEFYRFEFSIFHLLSKLPYQN